MISIKNKNNREIVIKGHANQNEFGNDIVCASVSTAVIMTLNQLEVFHKLEKVNYELKEGYSRITVYSEDDIIRGVFDNLVFTLRDLSLKYPKYIKIDEIL